MFLNYTYGVMMCLTYKKFPLFIIYHSMDFMLMYFFNSSKNLFMQDNYLWIFFLIVLPWVGVWGIYEGVRFGEWVEIEIKRAKSLKIVEIQKNERKTSKNECNLEFIAIRLKILANLKVWRPFLGVLCSFSFSQTLPRLPLR